MELRVVEKTATTEALVEVVRGGPLRAHKVRFKRTVRTGQLFALPQQGTRSAAI